MLNSWTVIFIALLYVGLLFAVASWGDLQANRRAGGAPRPLIYALSLGVYCTSWTFFGSVGLSARTGFEFLAIYLGPILVWVFGWPLLQSIVGLSKRHNITSIADFISARYGKNQSLGALVALIAVIGVVPYIALQLKAVSLALKTMLVLEPPSIIPHATSAADDLAIMVTIAMALFASLFGTRHIDTTEHQDGMILAIAVESVVKLVAFLLIGAFVTFSVLGGIGPLLDRIRETPDIALLFTTPQDLARPLTMTLLAGIAILLLPRQFHVTVVENNHESEVRHARWLFPAYLLAINIFVVPIAVAGLATFGRGTIDADSFVLALPIARGEGFFALMAFIGGLSAATAMVIVETVALSIMVCNNMVLPLILRRQARPRDMGRLLIAIRRGAIAIILVLAYGYYAAIGQRAALAQIGLVSFAAVAQFAPAFLIGLFWSRATALGATAGIVAGFAAWAYTLLLPALADAGWVGATFTAAGPWGIEFLRPRMIAGLETDSLSHGVLWSLGVNLLAFLAFSYARRPTPAEQVQASLFVPSEPAPPQPIFRTGRAAVRLEELVDTVARYLGDERARRSFAEFAASRGSGAAAEIEADASTLRYAEHLLASAVGAASSRLIMRLLLERHSPIGRGTIRLLDDASAAIQHNRDLLQSAIDHVPQGIAFFDSRLALIGWNRQFINLSGLPAGKVAVGTSLEALLDAIAAQPHARPHASVPGEALRRIALSHDAYQERFSDPFRVVEVRSTKTPEGGVAVSFADVTERVLAAEALEARVRERTAELEVVNAQLQRAKAVAEEANLGKTRFIAQASHDILQPLNAARLFAASLVERMARNRNATLARNLDSSLESVEEILTALLDISRLDAGALKPDVDSFAVGELIATLVQEHEPAARQKKLRIRAVRSRAAARSDRRLIRRILQNFLSNAIKYTDSGTVLIGCRRRGSEVAIEVHDTGRGIARNKLALIFREFERLDAQKSSVPGLGLGLSIVDRIAHILGHRIEVRSIPGRGSVFSILLPVAAAAGRDAGAPAAMSRRVLAVEGCMVAVIDNDRPVLEGMRNLLEGWGCVVNTAATARRSLELIETTRVDLILADYHLDDDDDGLSLIAAIREKAGRQVPAVLITADRSQDLLGRAASADVICMRKPVKPAALRAAMSHLLARMEAAE